MKRVVQQKLKRMDEAKTFELICAKVEEECKRRGISGVFEMAEVEYPPESKGKYILRGDVLDERYYQLLAVTSAKLNAMRSHRVFARGQIYLKYAGGVTYKGKDGHASEDNNFFYAFAGATEEVDAEIERLACEFHKTL